MSITLVKKRAYRLTATGIIVVSAGLTLTACQDKDENITQDDVANLAASEMVKDQQLAEKLLFELQQKDPNIIDAYITTDGQGRKVAVISRQSQNGEIESWTTPPLDEITQQATGNANQQQANSGGSTFGQAMMGAAVGAMLGYAVANMFKGAVNRSANAQQYQQQKTAAQSQYRQSVRQTQNRNAAARSSSFRRQGAFSNPSNTSNRSNATSSRGA